MFRMIAHITIEVAVLTVLTLAPSSIAVQNNRQPEQKPQTLTGCIQRGEAVSAYKLVAKDGIWNLSTKQETEHWPPGRAYRVCQGQSHRIV